MIIFQKCVAILTKNENKPNSRYIMKTFSTETYVFVKKVVLFSGDKGDHIDVWMIKITLKSDQIDTDVCFFQTWMTYKNYVCP